LSQLNNYREYPWENYIELKGLSPYLEARITVHKTDAGYDSEVDIILSESGKIYKHVTMLYSNFDEKEALDMGMHALKKYLNSLKNV
jgi:hypothetical protein